MLRNIHQLRQVDVVVQEVWEDKLIFNSFIFPDIPTKGVGKRVVISDVYVDYVG